MTEKTFFINPDQFTDDEKQLLKDNRIRFCKDHGMHTYHVSFMFSNSYKESHCWNIDVLKSIIQLLKNGETLDSGPVNNEYLKPPEHESYEYKYRCVDNNDIRKDIKTGKEYPHYMGKPIHLLQSNIVKETDDCYVAYDIPHGDTSEGRTDSRILYKNTDIIKQMALKRIDKQIEKALEYKKLLEES